MDYEKKYNSALERARNYYKGLAPCRAKDELELIFPELRESEDERIRKALVWHLKADVDFVSNGVTKAECIAYLEKQKEQKPTSTEEMPYITDEHFYEREPADSFKYKLAEYMTKCCTKKEGPYGYEYGISAESILKMAEEELLKGGVVQKPAEWSEKDEAMRDNILRLLDCFVGTSECESNPSLSTSYPLYQREIAWLKSLRPSWKPSEDEERLINTSISFLKDFADKGYENAVECIDWLKSKLKNGNSGK